MLLVKAVALALRKVPELNSVWEANRAVQKTDIHVGMAVAMRQGGLIAPALHHADRQSVNDPTQESGVRDQESGVGLPTPDP